MEIEYSIALATSTTTLTAASMRWPSKLLLLFVAQAASREPFVSPAVLEIFVHSTASNTTSVESSIVRGSSILLVSEFLSEAEREELMSAAATHESAKASAKQPKGRLLANSRGGGEALNAEEAVSRIHIALQFAEPTRGRGLAILYRALALLERSWPALAETLVGRSSGLEALHLECRAWQEPAITIYSKGGAYPIHRDAHALTVLVPLSSAGSFEGGGTIFAGDPECDGPSTVASPAAAVASPAAACGPRIVLLCEPYCQSECRIDVRFQPAIQPAIQPAVSCVRSIQLPRRPV